MNHAIIRKAALALLTMLLLNFEVMISLVNFVSCNVDW